MYLWWDVIDVVFSPLSSFLLPITWEVINILGGVTSRTQAGRDVVDLLGGMTDYVSVTMIFLVSQDGGWDVVHILWNWRLVIVVVVQVLAWRDLLDFTEVGWYVIGLLSDCLRVRNIFTDRWREVIDLKGVRESK